MSREDYDYDVGIEVPSLDPASWSAATRLLVEQWSRPGPNGEPPLRVVLLDMSAPPPWRWTAWLRATVARVRAWMES